MEASASSPSCLSCLSSPSSPMVLFLFLAHLAIGIAFTLVFVSRDAGVKFFRFNTGLAALLIVAAFAFRPSGELTAVGTLAVAALTVSEAATVMYWATVGRALASIRPALVALGCIAGVVALVAQAVSVTPNGVNDFKILTAASFLSSAALLGGASTAMILGHWYLVIPSMQVSHLQSIVKVHIASMVVRVVVVVAAVVVAVETWQPGLGPSFRHYITSVGGIFSGSACSSGSAVRHCCRISRGRPRRSDRRSRRPAFSTSISSPWSSARCWRSTCCSRRMCPCSKVDVCGLHRGPEPVQFQPTNRVRAGRQQR